MKRICIFAGYIIPHLGGVERYTDELAKELNKLDYDITIVTTNYNNFLDYEERQYCKVYRLPIFEIFKKSYPILKHNKKFRSIIKQINNVNFDAYICQTRFYLTTLLGVKIAAKKGKKALIIEHGSGHFTVNNKLFDYFGSIYEHFLTNRLKKYSLKFYGVSEKCNNWLQHFNICSSGVLYNSVSYSLYENFNDKEYIKSKNKDKIYISYVGRIIKEKGIDLLLQAFTDLNDEYDNIELYIAGEEVQLSTFRKLYTANNIHFEGNLSHNDVMKLYNQTDIFVYPSLYPEGLPTSILEAGLMKCAVISTDRGGTKEVIDNCNCGLIMDENLESLKENLKYLLENKDKIVEMKNNLHQKIVNNFTWKNTVENLLIEIDNS